jgi:hypothetical protein
MDDETVELSVEERRLAMNMLALVVAAGGKIVCKSRDMMFLMDWELVVTEDVATGDKVYEATRCVSGE